jgi:hypothetical protein
LFLETLAQGPSVERSAEVAGVAKQRFYERRKQDEVFAREWDEAYDAGTACLRDKNLQRATEGYTEVVRDGEGKVIRETQRIHPADLHLELKRRDPLFRENAQVAIGFGGPAAPVVKHDPAVILRRLAECGVLRIAGAEVADFGIEGEGDAGTPLALNPGPSVSEMNETEEAS